LEAPRFLPRAPDECLIYAGRNHVFFGPPESLKSWAALLACRSVLRAGLHALFVDFEGDPTGFVERARMCGISDEALGLSLRYVRPEEPLAGNETALMDWGIALQDLHPALVVMDGVTEAYALHGWDVNKASDAALFQQTFRTPPGVASIAIDHTGKEAARGIVGSLHKRAGIDGAAYEFAPRQTGGRGGTSKAEVKIDKDRHGFVRSFVERGPVGYIVVDPQGIRLETSTPPDTAAREAQMDQAVFLFVSGQDGCSKGDVRKGVVGKNSEVDIALQRLIDAGRIEDTGTNQSHSYQVK
jgi:hypothetical protein